MGRPKGSKNKSKLLPPAAQKELRKDFGKKITEEIDKEIIKKLKGLPSDVEAVIIQKEEPEDDDEPSLEDALKDLGGEGEEVKKVRGLKQKKVREDVDFLLSEIKDLRTFCCRVEDYMLGVVAKYPVPDIPVPELKKTRGKKPA